MEDRISLNRYHFLMLAWKKLVKQVAQHPIDKIVFSIRFKYTRYIMSVNCMYYTTHIRYVYRVHIALYHDFNSFKNKRQPSKQALYI